MIGKQVLPRGNTAVLMLALLFGVVSAGLIYFYLSSSGGEDGGGTAVLSKNVVVARQDIPVGSLISASMVEVRQVPVDLVVPNGFVGSEGVVGRVVLYPITAGEQITRSKFAAESIDNPALAEVVPRDFRGVSIQVQEVTAGGGLIRAGDRVDVILVFNDASAMTILQDVEVLAIAQNVVPKVATPEGEEAQTSTPDRQVLVEGESQPDAVSATLALTPQQAQVLLASEEFSKGGEYRLLDPNLRRALGLPEDEESVNCKGSLRLAVRPQAQIGASNVTARGLCAAVFLAVWDGYGLE